MFLTRGKLMVAIADWKWACVAAIGLTAAAAFVVLFLRPGGFEGQIGWLFVLLPGAIAGAPVSDRVYKTIPWSERIVLWTITFSISLLWYFVISFIAIKAYRLAAGTLWGRK
jgi:hypothetical protein